MIYPTIRVQSRKKYISAAFWNYISTPINFIITLFTGLTAGQTGSNNSYLNEKTVFIMLFVCFILSTINIFFKLKEKAELNYLSAKTYESFGNQFMKINVLPQTNDTEKNEKLSGYIELKAKIDDFISHEKVESVNYFTEFLYYCVQKRKSRKIINLLFENAKDETNEIFRQRIQVLAELKRTGVISGQEFNIILASLNEKLKSYKEQNRDWFPLRVRNYANPPQSPPQKKPETLAITDASYKSADLHVNELIQRTPHASLVANDMGGNKISRSRNNSFDSSDSDYQFTWSNV
jgi:hypothetical protein